MSDTTQITDALKKLDVTNDDHWTKAKEPAMVVLEELTGNKSLTREQVTAAAEGFTRDTAPGYWMNAPAANPWEGGEPEAQDAPQEEAAAQEDSPREDGAPEDGSGSGEPGPSDGETEQTEMEDDSDGEDEVEALAEALRAQEETVAELRVIQDAATKDVEAAVAVADGILEQLEALRPKNSNTQTIGAYLHAQKMTLQERGERQKKLVEAGVNLSDMIKGVSPSPVDQAMARKTGRGGHRPTRV